MNLTKYFTEIQSNAFLYFLAFIVICIFNVLCLKIGHNLVCTVFKFRLSVIAFYRIVFAAIWRIQ